MLSDARPSTLVPQKPQAINFVIRLFTPHSK